MPVSTQNPVISYTANGSVTSFSYPFRIIYSTDLKVYLNGVQTISGFSISGVDNPTGGSVVFAVPPANGVVVRLQRAVPLERTTDYVEGGQLAAQTMDNDFDRIVMMMQDNSSAPIIETPDGLWDAENKRIKNLADPINPQDAVNKQYYDAVFVPNINAIISAGQTSVNASVTTATEQAAIAVANAATATTQATTATTQATSASNSATAALGYLNTFKGQYYGALASAPATDPLGNAISVGDLYFNTTVNLMQVYNGSGWQSPAPILVSNCAVVAATGTTQGTAAPLNANINVINAGTSGSADGVILPAAYAGLSITILVTAAATIKVYPATGAVIESNAANAPISTYQGTRLTFIATSATQWYAMTAVYA